jgi:hypothetical protein
VREQGCQFGSGTHIPDTQRGEIAVVADEDRAERVGGSVAVGWLLPGYLSK